MRPVAISNSQGESSAARKLPRPTASVTSVVPKRLPVRQAIRESASETRGHVRDLIPVRAAGVEEHAELREASHARQIRFDDSGGGLGFLCASGMGSGLDAALTRRQRQGNRRAVCAGCREFFSRLGAGYTPDGWRTVMRMMINQGTPIPPDQVEAVTEYLIQSFPEKPKPPGVTIPGPVEVSIKIWPVPTPGSRPHDPLATADGAIWYTGQLANVLGRLDPKTGQIKEYPLKTPHSGPHGLVEDKDGNIW